MNVKAAGAVVLAMLMAACTGGAADPTRSKDECPALGAFPGAMQGGDSPFPEHGNGGYDVQRYTADLRIDPHSARLTLSSSIEAIATQDLTSFSFDHPGSAQFDVLVDDRRAAACQREGKLIIVPRTPITDGAKFVTTIETDGIPERGTADAGPGWVQTAASTIVAVGLRGETASWFPMNVTPRDKAAYTMRLSVPAGSRRSVRERSSASPKATRRRTNGALRIRCKKRVPSWSWGNSSGSLFEPRAG